MKYSSRRMTVPQVHQPYQSKYLQMVQAGSKFTLRPPSQRIRSAFTAEQEAIIVHYHWIKAHSERQVASDSEVSEWALVPQEEVFISQIPDASLYQSEERSR